MIKQFLAKYVQRVISVRLLRYINDSALTTLDAAIINKIIEPIVLTDLNLVGGRSIKIPLNTDMIIISEEDKMVLKIPASSRENSNIGTVTKIFKDYNRKGGSNNQVPKSSSIMDELKVSDGVTNLASETRLSIYGGEFLTILKEGVVPEDITDTILVADIHYSETLDEIDEDYYPFFGEICIQATKMYLFTLLDLEIDYVAGDTPAMSEAIRRKITSYENSHKDYYASISDLAKFSFLNDPDKMQNLITLSS